MFIFFAIQTSRHIKKNGRQTDRLSILTFVCLGASFFIFLVYGSLKAVLDIKWLTISNLDEELELDNWINQNEVMLDCVFAITRHPGYLLNNLALLFNIQRWSHIINKEQR